MPRRERGQFILSRAKEVAAAVVKKLKPYCKKIEAAGSIRRKRPWVNDIDIVLIPSDQWNLYQVILAINRPLKPDPDGPLIKKISASGIPVDIYIATDKTWATLLLIRTGSALNNIKLCSRARDRGWKLKADGSGLFNQYGGRIAGDTEASIYESLGLPFQTPEERG